VSALIARDQAMDPDDAGNKTVAMPKPIGVLKLLSFTAPSEWSITVTVENSAANVELIKAATEGTLLDKVTVKEDLLTMTLTEAVIASVNHDSDSITLTLKYKSIDQQYKPPDQTGPAPGSAGILD
jgi:hypothetical protein